MLLLMNNSSTSPFHIRQIQTQLITQNFQSNTTTIFSHFINACMHTHNLLHSALLLLLTHSPRTPHVYTCNSLIKAFAHSNINYIPNYIYTHMLNSSVSPNNYTYPFLLKSLSDFKELKQGQCVHAHVVKFGFHSDIYVQNALLSVYASGGRMGLCRKLFDQMSNRDVVSWTVMVTGYKDAGNYGDSLITFEQMQYASVEPNRVTMVNVLAACANFGAIEMGVYVHDFIKRRNWELDVILGTALVDMYAKCGRIDESIAIFHDMKEKNIYTWNVLIKGLALAKSGQEALSWFDLMQEEGFKPDEATITVVLSACGHSGLINSGRQIFNSLVERRYGFSPSIKHYACIIDLLSRGGHLEESIRSIKEMPFEPTKSMWGSLLNGCRDQNNLEMAEFVAWRLVELEPDNSAYYIVLSNLYAEMGRWIEVEKVRKLMRKKGLNKNLGYSAVEP
ncbi:hypothetical protein ACFE04_017762 [Oxalis oulophora]